MRPQIDLGIRSGDDSDRCAELDCGRHDEALVVVGVLANQIHAAGRAKKSWSAGKAALKFFSEEIDIHRQRVVFASSA